MSLTNRFSILLLATLGLTLTGFSTAMYATCRIYLDRQVDDRLASAMVLLDTCTDAKPTWVRWEPRRRRLPASRWSDPRATAWLVLDGDGRLLSDSGPPIETQMTEEWTPKAGRGRLPSRVRDRSGRSWRVAQRRVVPTGVWDPDDPPPERPQPVPPKSYHDALSLAAFTSLDETESTLATLGWFLFAISVLIWGLAALCARWLSRKTLVPLTRLVESARSLDASNSGWSLADVGTRDELDGLRQAFNDLLARLHEAYDRQRRFSSEASHQLRTPVAVMIGHLEVAQRHERSGDEYRRVIRMAHTRAVDLGRIVEALLFLSRPDSTTLTQVVPLELGRWLADSIEGRPDMPRSGDVVVNVDLDDPLWIKAQPHLLWQSVENLLDNACKYSQPGTAVVLSTTRDGDHAVLSVEDSGCGIAREDLPRIFEPFFRAPQASRGRIPGTGLGLSVVQRITRSFDGTLTVQSQVGLGSRFEIRLPIAAHEPDPDEGHRALNERTLHHKGTRTQR